MDIALFEKQTASQGRDPNSTDPTTTNSDTGAITDTGSDDPDPGGTGSTGDPDETGNSDDTGNDNGITINMSLANTEMAQAG